MHKALLLIAASIAIYAQASAQATPAQPAPSVPNTQWRSGLIELNDDWAEHDGDNFAWAQPNFDASTWKTVDLEDMGQAKTGWRWYRKHVVVGTDYPKVRLLLQAGGGIYELYVNGVKVEGADIRSRFAAGRPSEHVFTLDNDNGDFVIAIRTHVPASYSVYHFPLVMSVTLGQRTVIGYERQALLSERLYLALPSIAFNSILVLAGIAVLFLFASQRGHREYLYLGLYLLLIGTSNGIWIPQYAGFLPDSVNLLFSDPLTYLFNVAQIEFTFAFAGRKLSRGWRTFEMILLCAPLLAYIDFNWHVLGDSYSLIEAALTAPVALLLPVLLFVWYRRGNREAGWLMFPSLLPSLASSLNNLGAASIFLGWHKLDFLQSPIPVGPLSLQVPDLSSFLFLMAIGFVMFHRFTRVSREQAHSAAELEAAREIQQSLVPSELPAVAGFTVEAAFIPAQEVGGDFYQVLREPGGSALIVVGDVSGKGLRAAMAGTLAIGALRTLALEALGPAEILRRLNTQTCAAQNGGFITCLALRVDPNGKAAIANAGHLAPYFRGLEVEMEPALPLGIMPGARYEEISLQFSAGDKFVVLTDGVVEARNPAGELFGFARTAAISSNSANQIAKVAELFGQEDDITVLTLQFALAEVVHA